MAGMLGSSKTLDRYTACRCLLCAPSPRINRRDKQAWKRSARGREERLWRREQA